MSSESIIKKATSTPENSTNQELSDLELEAIAGGMRTITVEGPAPDYLKPRISMQLINYMQSYFGK
ncbi:MULTISPECIES: hypothetical protein [unclassified Microcoleus]|uniref:hypothetical protein n=1 Tax=unclassified Microcoleus TaxID=2642155 RepID=UPI002FD6730E